MSKASTNQKTVFVGLSGGVDSSVAALRLQKQGYLVVGVFIKVWHPDFLDCNWEEERLDAMRVAAKLGIPFLTCDAEEDYRKDVGEYFINEYLAGRTPNPDVMCNRYVKFGAFLRFAEENGADYIATGHYAEVKENNGELTLHRGVDHNKDQSYFLWTLTKDQLGKILFPVGSSPKDVIREEAGQAGLLTANKKDSQGVCFLGHVDIPEFLSHFTKLESGDVLDEEGQVIGTHQGALVYTLGQRHGFVVHTANTKQEAHYVVDKDVQKNTITVAKEPPSITPSDVITITDLNLLRDIKVGETLEVEFRYRQEPLLIEIISATKDKLEIKIKTSSTKPDSGQSAVFYRGDECLGGGIII